MSIPITNLLASSNINIILSGQHQYTINSKAEMYTLLFKGPSTQIGDISEINLNGSGCSGSYLGKAVTNTNNNRLKMTGSGGGNITGLPNIIYVNMTGIFDVNLTNNEGYITGKLHFTGLLEITINGTRGNLNLVNPYGVIYLNTQVPLELKITFLSITLENTSTSVTFANCTRYISLGDFSIRFQI